MQGKQFCSPASSSIRTAVCGHSHCVAKQLCPMYNKTADANNDSHCLDQVVGQNMSKHCRISKPQRVTLF